jgi:hypothetical protein
MELVESAPSPRSELVSSIAGLAEHGVWRAPDRDGPCERAVSYLVGRLAGELREIEQLVVRSRACLAVEERGLSETMAGIAREAHVAEGARSAAEALGVTASTVAAHAAALHAVYERLPAALAGTLATMEALEAGTLTIREGLRTGEHVSMKLAAGWLGAGEAVGEIAGSAPRGCARN